MTDTTSLLADAVDFGADCEPAPLAAAEAPPMPGFQAPKLSRYRPSERWADRWLQLRPD